MVTLEEATRKAREYLNSAGFPDLVLRLREITHDDNRNRWRAVFERIFLKLSTSRSTARRPRSKGSGGSGRVADQTFEELARLRAQRDHYWANALECAQKGELRKASELAWGAIAQALKALAASRWLHLGAHRQLPDFARDLSQATGNPYFRNEFRDLNALHVNFYDAILDELDFPEYLARAEQFIRRVAELMPHASS